MSLEKILQKIQSEINDLKPGLALFFEDSIQPSVSDCEALQQQLVGLQENLAVYKYQKQNYEISPSFNIHAKISEKEPIEEKITRSEPLVKKTVIAEEKKPEPELFHKTVEHEKPVHAKQQPKLVIPLNDKFRFINELFAQNSAEYNIAMEQLNNLRNWSDTEIYLNSLRSLYAWNENKEIVNYFYMLVKKRFD